MDLENIGGPVGGGQYWNSETLEGHRPPLPPTQWGIELILGPFVVHFAILGIDS